MIVTDDRTARINVEQAAGSAFLQGKLSNQPDWQMIIEFSGLHRKWCVHATPWGIKRKRPLYRRRMRGARCACVQR